MKAFFKWIVISLLIVLGIKGDVMVTNTTIDIHFHDTYYVIDFKFLLSLFAL